MDDGRRTMDESKFIQTGVMMNGLQHIAQTFEEVQSQGRAALMPYFTLGYPTLEMCEEILVALSQSGADLIELGIPFSDPLADGPTIQYSTQVALEQGASVGRCLELAARLRMRGVKQPLLFMGYYNPILAYGTGRFVEDAAAVGVDGFIIPDLPPEEAGEMEAACRGARLALVYLAAPTSTAERLSEAAKRTTGLLYLVSLTGVTGARNALSTDLQAFVERARAEARTPLAVGFGISTPDQARTVGRMADGVIVGSALIGAVNGSDEPVRNASGFLKSLRDALG